MSDFEPGPGLLLINARMRITRAVLATLTGPNDPTVSYAGSEKAHQDYEELSAAAAGLVAAQAAWDAAVAAKQADRAGWPAWASGKHADGHFVP